MTSLSPTRMRTGAPRHGHSLIARPPSLTCAVPDVSGGSIFRPSILVLCLLAIMVARPPWWSFNYAAILAVIAVALSGRPPRLRPLDACVLAIGGWAYTSLIWTGREDLTMASAYRYASVCLLFVACRHVIRSSRDVLLVGWIYVATCAVVAVELATGGRGGRLPAELIPEYAIGGIERNATAYTLSTGIVLGFVLAAVTWHRSILRLLPLAVILLLGYGVLLTRCRGAIIGVIVCLVAIPAAIGLARVTRTVLGVVTPALIIVVPIGVMPAHIQEWLDGLYRRPTGDFSGRLSIWPYALSTWWDAPLTGSGAGVFVSTNMFGYGPHNLLLTVGNDMGLIGVALYFGALAAALVMTARASRFGLALTCGFTGAMLPIWLSGQWEAAPAFWLVLAVLTTVPGLGLAADRPAPGRSWGHIRRTWSRRPPTSTGPRPRPPIPRRQ